jgi:cytochrome c oxidase assembly protein subunit 11
MSQHAKEYVFKDEEVNVYRKFKVSFLTHTQDEIPWEFEPSTPTIVVNAGETALSFYKVFNRADRPIAGIAIYQIFPEEAALYFNKIQCFCFENQLLYPNESLDMPLLFYLDPAICHDPALADCKEIYLTYHFFPSADQTIAEVLQVEIEKHQKEEMELIKRKKELISRGVVGIDDTVNHGVIAQGYNPKDRPDMFVKKIV